jgi:hypothetical protein
MFLNNGIQYSHFFCYFYSIFKMKTSLSKRKKKIEKIRKERIILFNKANNFGSNGANVYVIIEYNGKYFIYNNSDKEWPPSEIILISDIIFALFSVKDILTVRKKDIIRFRNGIFPTISVEK